MSYRAAYERLRGAVEAIAGDGELDLCGHRETLRRSLAFAEELASGVRSLPTSGRVHAGDPDTSRQAAVAVSGRMGKGHRECLREIERRGSAGAHWDELRDLPGLSSAQQRMSELKQAGYIKAVCTRETRRGASAQVFVITPAGIEWLAAQAVAA